MHSITPTRKYAFPLRGRRVCLCATVFQRGRDRMNWKQAALTIGVVAILGVGCARTQVDVGPDPDCPVCPDGAGAGSGGGGGSAPAHRLRQAELHIDGGLVVPVPGLFFDTLRKDQCTFRAPTVDGPMRCLPEAVLPKGNGYYADAACTAEVAIVGKCDNLPKYMYRTQQDGCFPTLASIHLLDPMLVPGTNLFLKSGDMCIPQGDAVGPNNVAFAVNPAIPWEDFVAGEVAP